MKSETKNAKHILISCFAIILIFNVFVISMSQSFSGGIRLLVTVALMYFVYIGHAWSKWAFSALALLGSFYSIFATKSLFDAGYSMFALFLGAFGIFWLFFGMYLVKSKPLQEFFSFQKSNRLPKAEIGPVTE